VFLFVGLTLSQKQMSGAHTRRTMRLLLTPRCSSKLDRGQAPALSWVSRGTGEEIMKRGCGASGEKGEHGVDSRRKVGVQKTQRSWCGVLLEARRMRDWWHKSEKERVRERASARTSDRARPSERDRQTKCARERARETQRDRHRESMLECKATDAACEGTWHMALR